jgi:hypothetical protein
VVGKCNGRGPRGAIAFAVMKHVLRLLALFFVCHSSAIAATEDRMVVRAKPYFNLLNESVDLVWPDAPRRSIFGSQIERESLWNPNAELCVPKPGCGRERGIGFGQMTITPRFNVFNEVSALHPELKGWHPRDYFDPRRQLIAVVAKDKLHYAQCAKLMPLAQDRLACVMSSYNGGFGGFSADRRLCSNTLGCDPLQWFGHVEQTSLKAKVPLHGYGQSFFQINRGYVCDVLIVRSQKYLPYLRDTLHTTPVACNPR